MPIDLPEMEGLSRDQVLTLSRCRTLEQYVSMYECYRSGACPFCDPLDSVKNRVIRANAMWRMWRNPFPQVGTKLHLILASHRHIGPDDEITSEDMTAAGELFLWARAEFKIMGGGFAMRFGSPWGNAGSVLHLHANVIVPDGTGDVSVALAKDPERHARGVERMKEFEKQRLAGNLT